jgi:hypothetical protein
MTPSDKINRELSHVRRAHEKIKAEIDYWYGRLRETDHCLACSFIEDLEEIAERQLSQIHRLDEKIRRMHSEGQNK